MPFSFVGLSISSSSITGVSHEWRKTSGQIYCQSVWRYFGGAVYSCTMSRRIAEGSAVVFRVEYSAAAAKDAGR